MLFRSLGGPAFAGALSGPVGGRLRWRPVAARPPVGGGRAVVGGGVPVHAGLDEQLAVHRGVSERMQAAV